MDDEKVQVNFVVTRAELNQIKNNATACDKTVSAYIREVALNMCTIPIDHTIVTEHTEEIASSRNAINRLVYTIKKSGNYVPADLEFILQKVNEMLNSEKTFLNNYDSFIVAAKKELVRTVRKTVKEHLSPSTKSSKKNKPINQEGT